MDSEWDFEGVSYEVLRKAKTPFGETVREAYYVDYGFTKLEQIASLLGWTEGWLSQVLNHPESKASKVISHLLEPIRQVAWKERIRNQWLNAVLGELPAPNEDDQDDPQQILRTVALVKAKITGGNPQAAEELVRGLLDKVQDEKLRDHLRDIAYYLSQRLESNDQSMKLSDEMIEFGQEQSNHHLVATGLMFKARAIRTARGANPEVVLDAHRKAAVLVNRLASLPEPRTSGYVPSEDSVTLERAACNLFLAQHGRFDEAVLNRDLERLAEVSRNRKGARHSGSLFLRASIYITLHKPVPAEELLDEYRHCEDPAQDIKMRHNLLRAAVLAIRGETSRADERYRALIKVSNRLNHLQIARIASRNRKLLGY